MKSIMEIPEIQKLRLKFEPYKNYNFLFFITEINVRSSIMPFFSMLGVKNVTYVKNVEELRYEIRENAWEETKSHFSICIMNYHREKVGYPAYIASLLQSLRMIPKNEKTPLPFLVYANSNESLEIQFGKNPKTRTLAIRAAAKSGLNGLVIGSLESVNTANIFIEKLIEILEDDELAKMTTFERYLRKLIHRAYAFLNKIFGNQEDKEKNIDNAVCLFEEVLEQSKNNREALIGKATALVSSSDVNKICEGCDLFSKLEIVSEDAERVFEGHAGACYKMAKLSESDEIRQKWLLKSFESLDSLTEWQLKEYKIIKQVQPDFHDPILIRQVANRYSLMAKSLIGAGDKHTITAIKQFLNGIKMDPKLESNYQVIPLMKGKAKKSTDYLKIAEVCSTARENIVGKEIDFLISEAEAYFDAGMENKATKLFNSIDKYVDEKQINEWSQNKTEGVTLKKQDAGRIGSFISFLNHRAIHYRKIKQYTKSFDDLSKAISLDTENNYYDIYYNMAKAILTALNDNEVAVDCTKNNAFEYLFVSIKITLNIGLDRYELLLKTIKEDAILGLYINEIKDFLIESHYSVPPFFK